MSHSKRRRHERALERRIVSGVAPGTVAADSEAPQPRMTVLQYGPDEVREQRLTDPRDKGLSHRDVCRIQPIINAESPQAVRQGAEPAAVQP